MDPQNQQQYQPQNTAPQKSSVGSIIGTIIIIAVIILGGLYFWGKRIEENRQKEGLASETTVMEQSEAAAIKSVSSSDELDSIDADLKATSFSNLSAEAQ